MLKDLIAQAFCGEIRRKLRRLGVLSALVGAYFAIHVELPLDISIATREAQAAMAGLQRSMERTLAQSRHHILEMHRLQAQLAKRSHPRIAVTNYDRTN
jgi:hypothetical protein